MHLSLCLSVCVSCPCVYVKVDLYTCPYLYAHQMLLRVSLHTMYTSKLGKAHGVACRATTRQIKVTARSGKVFCPQRMYA